MARVRELRAGLWHWQGPHPHWTPGEREPVIVLTAPWHERDTQALVRRLGAPVFAPPPDTAQDLIDKYGITAEQAGDGSPDLKWLRSGGAKVVWYAGGDHNALVLWEEGVGAVIAGDSLTDFGAGLTANEGRRADATRREVVE